MTRRLFALDEGFPQPIVDVMAPFMPEAELVPIERIDGRLRNIDDWEVLLALHQDERAWDGLITTDADMLSLPKELSVICQTKLTVIATESAGHDPLKATGLVLAHLPGISKRTRRDTPQIWVLRTAQRDHDQPWEYLRKIARRHGKEPGDLYAEMKLTDELLKQKVLS